MSGVDHNAIKPHGLKPKGGVCKGSTSPKHIFLIHGPDNHTIVTDEIAGTYGLPSAVEHAVGPHMAQLRKSDRAALLH